MAASDQQRCDRCQEPLRPAAAYCDKCGERTRRARRLVGIAIRVELLFVFLTLILILGFAGLFYVQR